MDGPLSVTLSDIPISEMVINVVCPLKTRFNHNILEINSLRANLRKWSNTLKQFVSLFSGVGS